MKTRTKALILALAAILLVVTTVFATVAYLQMQTAPVTNTFTAGKVAIELDELEVDIYGAPETDGEGEPTNARGTGNEYRLVPGLTYTKDPVVRVLPQSEKCYVYVKVENGISAIEKAGATTIAQQMENNNWSALGNGVTDVYYQLVDRSDANNGKSLPVFASFTIDSAATNATVGALDDAEVVVTAYAVQADGFDSAYAAWTAAAFS